MLRLISELVGLVHGFEFFIEEFSEIHIEKMNVKILSEPKLLKSWVSVAKCPLSCTYLHTEFLVLALI